MLNLLAGPIKYYININNGFDSYFVFIILWQIKTLLRYLTIGSQFLQ